MIDDMSAGDPDVATTRAKRLRGLAEVLAEAKEYLPHLMVKKAQWDDNSGWFVYFE